MLATCLDTFTDQTTESCSINTLLFNSIAGFPRVRISSGGQLDVRRKVPLTRNLGVEVCGNVEFPLPQAQYAVHDDESR